MFLLQGSYQCSSSYPTIAGALFFQQCELLLYNSILCRMSSKKLIISLFFCFFGFLWWHSAITTWLPFLVIPLPFPFLTLPAKGSSSSSILPFHHLFSKASSFTFPMLWDLKIGWLFGISDNKIPHSSFNFNASFTFPMHYISVDLALLIKTCTLSTWVWLIPRVTNLYNGFI